jgi:hypothetical protein
VTKYIYNPNIDLRTGNYTNSILYVGIYGYSNTKYSIVLNAQGKPSESDQGISTLIILFHNRTYNIVRSPSSLAFVPYS